MPSKDLFGKAILDYANGNYSEDIITSTSISEEDVLPLPYLFRDYNAMPKIERQALDLCNGKVLDIGCGAGSHSLYLQELGLEVKGIDISQNAVKACKKRGLINVQCKDFIEEIETFDTILLLMNGSGVFRSLSQLPYFLNHLKILLNPNGQVLIDSSDIKYMYQADDGSYPFLPTTHYYGELDYNVSYKGDQETFQWMYLDFDNLQTACKHVGLKCDLILEGDHFDFLAKLNSTE